MNASSWTWILKKKSINKLLKRGEIENKFTFASCRWKYHRVRLCNAQNEELNPTTSSSTSECVQVAASGWTASSRSMPQLEAAILATWLWTWRRGQWSQQAAAGVSSTSLLLLWPSSQWVVNLCFEDGSMTQRHQNYHSWSSKSVFDGGVFWRTLSSNITGICTVWVSDEESVIEGE